MLPGKKFPNFLQFSDEIFQKRNCINFSETLCAETSNLILLRKKEIALGFREVSSKIDSKVNLFHTENTCKTKESGFGPNFNL